MANRVLSHETLLSLVIPMYNEEPVLGKLFERLDLVVQSLPVRVEVVLVNDGSRDRTLEIATAQVQRNPVYRVINLSRNFGHQMAVSAALSLVRGDVVAIIDADLQDPPELLMPMLERWRDGVDVVYGQRRERKGETRFKLITASLFYRFLSKMTTTNIPRNTGDFRIMDRRLVLALNNMPEQHRFLRGMVAWLGYRQEPFLYDRDPRVDGETKYPLKKMIAFSLDAIFSFSTKPLHWMSILGFGMTFFGIVAAIIWVILRLAFPHLFVHGVVSILVTVWFLFGVNFLCLGVLGEYLGRVFINVQGRPHYIIHEVISAESFLPAETTDTEKDG
ncbi:MAG: glycosyltransferase family 2 protein [Magnetococcales bacterium]|nr:glycosyltransferase family 2 protein [Magnetococcales bacterium]MBF0148986.1 glycosyltransferase family 2 protein [Magnetococcales bacterium]MBF0603052.1 glycosyltransferase family 2 protein [Magnetococcales bacterium]